MRRRLPASIRVPSPSRGCWRPAPVTASCESSPAITAAPPPHGAGPLNFIPRYPTASKCGAVPSRRSRPTAVEAEIEAALAPRVALPGGGELVFEPGETLTAIDVNSVGFVGKAMRAARDLNLAAAPELARQISLRNIAGAIVVDLLRMEALGDREAVLRAMREKLAGAPVECDVLGISRMGLLELTRRRRGPSLAELMLEPAMPARLRADAAALAALRRVMATARPGAGVTLAAAPEVVAELEGPLANALADAARTAGAIHLRAEPGWPRERAEVIIGAGT